MIGGLSMCIFFSQMYLIVFNYAFYYYIFIYVRTRKTMVTVSMITLSVKGGGSTLFKKTFKMKYRVLISILKY